MKAASGITFPGADAHTKSRDFRVANCDSSKNVWLVVVYNFLWFYLLGIKRLYEDTTQWLVTIPWRIYTYFLSVLPGSSEPNVLSLRNVHLLQTEEQKATIYFLQAESLSHQQESKESILENMFLLRMIKIHQCRVLNILFPVHNIFFYRCTDQHFCIVTSVRILVIRH